MIRNRAADPNGWVHTYIDSNDPSKGFTSTPAAYYFIRPYPEGYFNTQGKEWALKAIYYERMLELGMEGHRFFDLVRWRIADTEINTYIQKEKVLRTYLNNAVFTKGKNEYFPIPQVQIDLSAGADGVKKNDTKPRLLKIYKPPVHLISQSLYIAIRVKRERAIKIILSKYLLNLKEKK